MSTRQFPDGFVSPEIAAETLPLSPKEVRVRCAQFISSQGADRHAVRCINVNAAGASKPRYAIPVTEVSDWLRRQMTSTSAGGVL